MDHHKYKILVFGLEPGLLPTDQNFKYQYESQELGQIDRDKFLDQQAQDLKGILAFKTSRADRQVLSHILLRHTHLPVLVADQPELSQIKKFLRAVEEPCTAQTLLALDRVFLWGASRKFWQMISKLETAGQQTGPIFLRGSSQVRLLKAALFVWQLRGHGTEPLLWYRTQNPAQRLLAANESQDCFQVKYYENELSAAEVDELIGEQHAAAAASVTKQICVCQLKTKETELHANWIEAMARAAKMDSSEVQLCDLADPAADEFDRKLAVYSALQSQVSDPELDFAALPMLVDVVDGSLARHDARALDSVFDSGSLDQTWQRLLGVASKDQVGQQTKLSSDIFELPMTTAKTEFEKMYYLYWLHKTNGNISEIARLVGRQRSDIYRSLRKLNVDAKDYRQVVKP